MVWYVDITWVEMRRCGSKVFHMNRWTVQNRNVSIVGRLRYFESVVSSVACFAGGHRAMYTCYLERLDTHHRKLCKSIVAPPPSTGWTFQWREKLHEGNVRVNILIDGTSIKTWSQNLNPTAGTRARSGGLMLS